MCSTVSGEPGCSPSTGTTPVVSRRSRSPTRRCCGSGHAPQPGSRRTASSVAPSASIGAAASTWDRGGRQPSDLYRGGRLDRGARRCDARTPSWLRSVDHEFIEASHAQAEVDQRTEQRRIRRLRRLVAGSAVALIAALVAGSLAFTQQRRADRAARAAEEAAFEADTQRRAAEDQATLAEEAAAESDLSTIIARSTAIAADQPDVALLLALEARRRSPGPITDRALLECDRRHRTRPTGREHVTPAGPSTATRTLPSRRIDPDWIARVRCRRRPIARPDLVTGETSNRGTPPEPCVTWFEDADTGHRWASRSRASGNGPPPSTVRGSRRR